MSTTTRVGGGGGRWPRKVCENWSVSVHDCISKIQSKLDPRGYQYTPQRHQGLQNTHGRDLKTRDCRATCSTCGMKDAIMREYLQLAAAPLLLGVQRRRFRGGCLLDLMREAKKDRPGSTLTAPGNP